jgi:hypothetical protein
MEIVSLDVVRAGGSLVTGRPLALYTRGGPLASPVKDKTATEPGMIKACFFRQRLYLITNHVEGVYPL